MPLRRWIKISNHAIEGILHAAKTQRHMRYHFYTAILILIVSFSIGISWAEVVILITLSIIVLSVEMLNSALETITDILFREYDEKDKRIKDMAAGAVLKTAIGAAVIGFFILYEPVKNFFYTGLNIAKHAESDVAVVALIVVLILVVL